MEKWTSDSFKAQQLTEIVKFQTLLQEKVKRDIPLSEAIINWIALGYAEEYREGYLQKAI